MSQVCEKCGKGPTTGHNVSYSQRKTKRRFIPNLQKWKGQKLCTRCLRTMTNKM